MSDIVERLRKVDPYDYPMATEDMCEEAATEIETLRAALRVTDDMVNRVRKELGVMNGMSIIYPSAYRVRLALEVGLTPPEQQAPARSDHHPKP